MTMTDEIIMLNPFNDRMEETLEDVYGVIRSLQKGQTIL